jgi:hypothetical protein
LSTAFDLKSLLAEVTVPAAVLGLERDLAMEQLRLKLAVRGWTDPRAAIETADQAEQNRLLEALAIEVETAIEARPGRWYLAAPIRRRVLAQASRQELRGAVKPHSPEDRDDPLRAAFAAWLAPSFPPLASLPDPVLAVLGNVSDWLGAAIPAPITATEIEAERVARTLNSDLARMTRYPLVGAAHRRALGALDKFAARPGKAQLSAIYVYGGGGSGKTTLLAFLQQQLQEAAGAVARIDFDEPAIDPTRMATLNVALFAQLTRTVQGLRGRSDFILTNLRAIAQGQRSSSIGNQPRRKTARPAIKRSSNISSETWETEKESSASSILYGTLASTTLGGPLVLILDTAELVLTHSDRVAAGVIEWLRFLQMEAGARDLRLIIAGRDPPPTVDPAAKGYAVRNLLERLAQINVTIEPAIPLPELEPAESAELLRNCGVTDPQIAEAAAAAVPGNPLLLRITADALRDGGEEVQRAVREAHRAARIDEASARNYLMRRVVAHVPDPEARPYVLAAMFSPVVTARLLEEAIIPAVDRATLGEGTNPAAHGRPRKFADRVFRALATAQWLTRPSLDAKTLSFNRDLRSFVLRLLRSGVADETLERDVRQSAVTHHRRGRDPQSRAMALYHLALLGSRYTRPRGSSREVYRNLLRDVLEELPVDLRLWLDPPQHAAKEGAATGGHTTTSTVAGVSEAEWRLYVEGTAGKDGQGTLLVKDDKADQALELYLARPTRPAGLAPAFVVRALADLGRWHDPLVNVDAILATEAKRWLNAKRYSPDDLSQIYWITRLALQQKEGLLSGVHIEILRHVSRYIRGPGLTQLPALIAVAEAAMMVPIMGASMRQSAFKVASEARVMLGFGSDLGKFQKLEIPAGQLVVVQADWLPTLGSNRQVRLTIPILGLDRIQEDMTRLDGKPIAQVNQLFDSLSDAVPFLPYGLEHWELALLCRGRTPEFHRPMREALLTICGDGIVGPLTRKVIDPVLQAMSIRPAEMRPDVFYERLAGNPRAWAAALIGFADQARLLPLLAQQLAEVAPAENAREVARSFLAWDRALCRGGSSLWGSAQTKRA